MLCLHSLSPSYSPVCPQFGAGLSTGGSATASAQVARVTHTLSRRRSPGCVTDQAQDTPVGAP